MPPNPFSGGLSVKISAATADFEAGISRAKDSLGDLSRDAVSTSGSLQVLQGRADEAGDEITSLGRDASGTSRNLGFLSGSAVTAGGALSGMGSAASAANVSFSSLANTSLLVVLPALTAAATALLSVLFPLAAAAGTAALALGGLGGAVAVGTIAAAATNTDLLANKLQTVKEAVLEAVEPIADAFLPLLMAVLSAIPEVVRETVRLTGGFVEFRNELWGVISLVLDSLPRALALLYDLGRQALPFVRDFIMFLRTNGEQVLRSMLATTREIAPAIMSFVTAFVNAVPALTRIGTTVLQTVIPALNAFFDVIRNIGQRAQGSGGGLISALGNMLVDAFNGLLTWLKNSTAIQNAVSDIMGFAASLLGNISEEDTQRAVDAVLNVVAGIFDGVTGQMSEDGGISQQIGRLTGEVMASFADSMTEYVRSDAFQQDLVQFASAMQTALGDALEGLSIGLADASVTVPGTDVEIPLRAALGGAGVALEGLDRLSGGNGSGGGSGGGGLSLPAIGLGAGGFLQGVTDAATSATGAAASSGAQEVRVVVESADDKFEAFVDGRVQQGFRRAGRDIDASGVR